MARTVEQRFWSKVDKGAPVPAGRPELGPCWVWTKSCRGSGYGQFRVSVDASPQRASRVAWRLTHGDPGESLVLHHCDNPPCCNPAHLFLGTCADNNHDKIDKGRARYNMPVLVERVRRLSDDQIAEVRRRHAGGESCRSIARGLGVAHTTVSRLVGGKHWRGTAV